MNKIIARFKDFNFINTSIDENATIHYNVHKITKIKKEYLIKQGIDVESMVKNIQIDEMHQSISKEIILEITNSSTKTLDINIDSMVIEKQREDKITEIFDEENPERPIRSNTRYAQTILHDNLCYLCYNLKPNVIITNVGISASIQDLPEFKSVDESNNISLVYNPHHLIGSIFGSDVYTDGYMRYDDNRIFICNVDLDLIHTDDIKWNDDYTKLKIGYDIKIKQNSKVETLNIIDTSMYLV